MRHFFISCCFVVTALCFSPIGAAQSNAEDLYSKLNLDNQLNYEVFKQGLAEFKKTPNKQKPYLTIIDYTKPSTAKRLFVIDVDNEVVLFNTHVAHGKNTGVKNATKFSNTVNSKQTSLGVFLTADTYWGGNGYSLRLDGLTPGKNDNARRRYIVVHGADYAEQSFIDKHGRLGRSWGCPAVPRTLAKAIIDTIKDGSVIYAYG